MFSRFFLAVFHGLTHACFSSFFVAVFVFFGGFSCVFFVLISLLFSFRDSFSPFSGLFSFGFLP